MKNKIKIGAILFIFLFSANLIINGVMFFRLAALEKTNQELISEINGQFSGLDISFPDYSESLEWMLEYVKEVENLLHSYKIEPSELLIIENDIDELLVSYDALLASHNEDINKILFLEFYKMNNNIIRINNLLNTYITETHNLFLSEINKLREMIDNIEISSPMFENMSESIVPAAEIEIAPAEIERTPAQIESGQAITINIRADQVLDMYGYQFRLYFDKEDFEYNGGLSSSISGISTIFAREFDTYLLVGATKIGSESGFSGENINVCRIILTAKKDLTISEISIGGVNVVKSDETYIENITGWEVNIEK